MAGIWLFGSQLALSFAQDEAPTASRVVRIPVPLPIKGDVDDRVIKIVDKRLSELQNEDERPTFIFEFKAEDETAGSRSRFEDALSLARYLAGSETGGIRTVAYISGAVKGHAVLPVIACEQIIADPKCEFGAASLSESDVDQTMRRAYSDIAERRRTIPAAVANAMLDPASRLSVVTLTNGSKRYVLDEELKSLRDAGEILSENTLSEAGDLAQFSGQSMRLEHGFASHLAANQKELADALSVPPEALNEESDVATEWQAFRVDIRRPLMSHAVNDVIGRIETARASDPDLNLLVLWIDSSGGDPLDAMRLATYLAELDIQTVAYISGQARSVAVLIALVCDNVYVQAESTLGGPGEVHLSERALDDLQPSVRTLAEIRQRDWSLWMGLLDERLSVHRYQEEGTGSVRYFCDQELEEQPEPEKWQREARLNLSKGVSGSEAVELGLAKATVNELADVLDVYYVDEELEEARQQWLVESIQRLAAQPWFARTLLFIAFFALISEASAPGVGLPGFVSALCFLFFFWAQFLNGTAGWLEVMLFVGGLICIAVEFLLLPGFGVFGVGGILMVISSLVLASQTFVIPRNSYQFSELPASLWAVSAGGSGMLVALWVMRRYLSRAPIVNRMMLDPPSGDEIEAIRQREAIVSWDHLMGKTGITTTRLGPTGKAQFGDDIVNVISDGEMLPPGTKVAVSEVLGNRVLVRALDDGV